MNIVKIEANEIGYRPPILSSEYSIIPEGYSQIESLEFMERFNCASGFVNMEVQDGLVVSLTENEAAKEAYFASLPPAPSLNASEQRENAYKTEAIIAWQGKIITVTAAAALWTYYTSEGDTATANALTEEIARAKMVIRDRFPDVSNSDTGD